MRTLLWMLGFIVASIAVGALILVGFGFAAFEAAGPYVVAVVVGAYVVFRIAPRYRQ